MHRVSGSPLGHRPRDVVSTNSGHLLTPGQHGIGSSDWDHRPSFPERGDAGIGVVGAGFIVRDSPRVAYAEAGFHVVGITSRTIVAAREVAALRAVPTVH